MDMSVMAGGFLAAMAAGGVAYVFLYPLLSGEADSTSKLSREHAVVEPMLGPTEAALVPPARGTPADAAPATDQRGLPRIKDGNGDGVKTIDIGAVER